MARISVDGDVELTVTEFGPEEGHPVVFLHGWPLDHRLFEGQYHALVADGYRCLGVDLRGFGDSDKPYGAYSYDVFAEDVQAVVDHYDLEAATLVGFSMGGGVATHYMGAHGGDGFDQLVLLSAAAPCLIERPDFPEGLPEGAFDPLIESLRIDRPTTLADFFGDLYHTEQSDAKMEFLRHLAMEAGTHATVACAEMFRDADLRPVLDGIDVPTLVCHGLEDQITPFEATGAVLADRIADAELVRFEDCGHGLTDDDPAKLNETLLNSLP